MTLILGLLWFMVLADNCINSGGEKKQKHISDLLLPVVKISQTVFFMSVFMIAFTCHLPPLLQPPPLPV